MEKIKLVIWDLDETFWKGTLSEEGIRPIAEHIHLVQELTKRGIINSIVSKNDFETAKNKLVELGIWEYFVFPAIEWKPKGLLVQQIIENCQLRDVNVLFLDDLAHNLNEAKFYNPNLVVQAPDFIPEILTHPSFEGKDDSSHSRLKQYKLLEEKASAKTKFSDNLAFLEDSQIKLQRIYELEPHAERITELINRSNQLNFTKIRLQEHELKTILTDTSHENVAIQVRDKYGDYGIVGFYSYNRANHGLAHFVFSCRILNLGIPQYIYASLGFPSLSIIPEVAEALDKSQPHWIEEVQFTASTPPLAPKHSKDPRILFIGGCEYSQLFFYLENSGFNVRTHVNFNNDQGFIVRPSHSAYLIGEKNYSQELQQQIVANPLLPYVTKENFDSGLYASDFDCVVYNPRMDYELDMYQHITAQYIVPYGGFGRDWCNPADYDSLIQTYQGRKVGFFNRGFLADFAASFTNLGRITPEQFIQNLEAIQQSIPASKPLILMNCPEVELSFNPNGTTVAARFKEMNEAMDQFVSKHSNVYLLDIRQLIDEESKITTDLGHFQRRYYKEISTELLVLINQVLQLNKANRLSLKSRIGGIALDGIELAKKIKRKLLR
ncbi:MAG: HAD hydrolase-like protein [Mongoliitalea sp.]